MDKEKIKKYIPRSNWEKYFSEIVEVKAESFQEKWKLLYKYINKVAHNRFLDGSDFRKITGLCKDTKTILLKALEKLGELDLKYEDRQRIENIYKKTYLKFDSQIETAVAGFYERNEYKILFQRTGPYFFDFVAEKANDSRGSKLKRLILRTPVTFYTW